MITKTQLENSKITKKEVRQLYRKFGQCAYYNYNGQRHIVTHGGISNIPDNLTFVATAQMIKGVGNYNDFETVAESFVKNTPERFIQSHGHRNTKHLPVQVNERVFNLEGRIEMGGCLRAVQFSQDGSIETFEVKNNVFREPDVVQPVAQKNEKTVGDVILELRKNRYIQEKRYGNISSFNFTKTAFYDRVWDEQTTKARGLYINVPKQKVVARAYDKFFNINFEYIRVDDLNVIAIGKLLRKNVH